MSTYNVIDHDYDVLVVGAGGSGLRAAVGLSEIFEEYIHNKKIKDVANLLVTIFSIIIPVIILILLIYKI